MRSLVASLLTLALWWGATEPAPGRIGLVVPRYLVAGGGGAPVLAQVFDAHGAPIADGAKVGFVGTLGVRFDPVVATTIDGLAHTSVAAGTEAGFARIDAASGSARTNVLVWVRPAPAKHVLFLEAQPSLLPPGGTAVVRAKLTDRYGNPAEGDQVSWAAGLGNVDPVEARILRGEVETEFKAGPVPGPAWVRLAGDGPTSRVAIAIRGALDRDALSEAIHLPFAAAVYERANQCRSVLVNGSFERAKEPSGQPVGWELTPVNGAVQRLAGHAADGAHWLRMSAGQGEAPAYARQELWVAGGAADAQLRLWVRGGVEGAKLRLSIRSLRDVGAGPVRDVLYDESLAVDDRSWTLLSVGLPSSPLGPTTLEISPQFAGSREIEIDVDDVRLELCE